MSARFTWSYSKLKNFETCAKRHLHYDIMRDIKEPTTPELQAGWDAHAAFEARLVRGTALPLGMLHLEPLMVRIAAAPGKLYGEQKLALTSAFTPCAFFAKDAWFRTVIDCTVVNGKFASIADWKDGKVKEDLTQLQLMALTMFATVPTLERIKAALVFYNHGHVEPAEFRRDQVSTLWSEILPRVRAMQRAAERQEYPANPSGLCKKYCAVISCPFHGKGSRG